MNDSLFVSDVTLDPNAMARVANLLIESARFHAPQYAWAFSRYRAIGDITVDATDTEVAAGRDYKGQQISVETRVSITLATEVRPAGLIVSVVASLNAAAKCDYYSLGSFTCGAAASAIPASQFTLESMNDAIHAALCELVAKASTGLGAVSASLIPSKLMR